MLKLNCLVHILVHEIRAEFLTDSYKPTFSCDIVLCAGAGVLAYFAGAGVCSTPRGSTYLCCKLLSDIGEKT
jgi:hypothetical protein